MRLSIQRLRWVLIAGALLLITVLAAFIGYGRYRALQAYRQIIARSGVSITHDSNGVTYSQSIKGRKVFTLRAKSESSLGDGKYALHNAELWLYDHNGHPADHISGSEIEYDENAGIARAAGQVFMDIEPPQGLANSGRNSPAPTRPRSVPVPVIHVRTSGLVYLRKLGVASTDQQVDFTYGDMHCTARGAEFNSDQHTVRLLSQVQADGLARGKPLHLIATRADINRDENIATLTDPVVTTDGRSMKADVSIIDFRKDGSIERVQGNNHVVLTAGTQKVTANRLDATLNLQSIPQTAKFSGDILLVDANPVKPMDGSANAVDVMFNAQGSPTSVVATGDAKLSMIDRKKNSRGLDRSIEGARIVANFSPGQRKSPSRITQLRATGSAHASGESIAYAYKGTVADKTEPLALKNVQVWADDLQVLFAKAANGKAQPETLYGTGHTQLQQDAPLGEQEISTGARLEIAFAPVPVRSTSYEPGNATMGIASAVQSGDVTIHDRAAGKMSSTMPGAVSTGTADRVVYDGSTQELTLAGNVHLYGEDGSLIAPVVRLDQRTQDAEAKGWVEASFQNVSAAPGKGISVAPNAKPVPVTHVLAASAHFDHAEHVAIFYGTEAQPARMWQDASQVQAGMLLFDGVHRTFSARPVASGGLVHAIFASNPVVPKSGFAARAATIIRVSSPKMDYSELQSEATFSGGVTIDASTGEVRGQQAVLFLTAANKPSAPIHPGSVQQGQPSPLNGSIDRMVVSGNVQMEQPGRHGTGDQLLYSASTGNYILTGTLSVPPRIVDAQQGTVTGTTLLFGDAGSTIVVAGTAGAPKGKGGRVRTETHVNPAKEERH